LAGCLAGTTLMGDAAPVRARTANAPGGRVRRQPPPAPGRGPARVRNAQARPDGVGDRARVVGGGVAGGVDAADARAAVAVGDDRAARGEARAHRGPEAVGLLAVGAHGVYLDLGGYEAPPDAPFPRTARDAARTTGCPLRRKPSETLPAEAHERNSPQRNPGGSASPATTTSQVRAAAARSGAFHDRAGGPFPRGHRGVTRPPPRTDACPSESRGNTISASSRGCRSAARPPSAPPRGCDRRRSRRVRRVAWRPGRGASMTVTQR
jgi:hypothetical protein